MKTPRRNIPGSVNPRKYSEQIPDDLIIEILSRLPAKSVARCRCVSKFWNYTSSLPCFSELFLTRSSSPPQLLFSYEVIDNLLFYSSPQPQNTSGYSLSLVSANYQTNFPIDGYLYKTSGSIHGLVCVTHIRNTNSKNEMVAVICNPNTGQSLTLPKLRAFAEFFLGYDPIDKQYKVMSMIRRVSTATMISWDHQVLTLGTENPQWRKVKCSINCLPLLEGIFLEGICISGVLYYVAFVPSEKGSEYMIVCFEVRSEKFRSIKVDKDMMSFLNVAVLVNYKGKLGALLLPNGRSGDITRTTRSFEMWVLENTEKHEWSKHVYKFPNSFLKNVVQEPKLSFIGVTGTNEIVFCPIYLSNPFIVFYYNIEKKTIRRDEIEGMDGLKISRVHTSVNHVENVKKLMDAS